MSPPSTPDRDVLLGLLALQLDLVSRQQLLAAVTDFLLDRGVPLAERLQALAALTPAQMDALARQVEDHLSARGDGVPTVVAGDGTPRPGEDTLLDHAPAAPAGEPRRFRVVRPHARGGLGEVFVAEDMQLHRHVALKAIQPQHADHPDSRARFVLEAEITGGLEHPGIVPVYGLGVYADGRPFYAMRFIQGENLLDAIRGYHTDRRSSASDRNLAFRALLGRFVAVCQAVAYAHNRGVIHRDLKPGNIMLGKFGETLVVDWGLAKATGQRDPSDEPALQPWAGDGVDMTAAGQAVGTPAYMSPEQAGGQRDAVGPASDVYSLGATLYVLLTGQLAFKGTVAGVLEQVRKGDFPPPRRVTGDVPAPLEAVCLRAMALTPEHRYASALALAADVEHYLADEPVSAYREPWHARLSRWVRRNRVKVSVAAAALLLVTTFSIAGAVLVQRQNAQLGRKNDELEDANQRVRESARDARQAIEDMTSEEALKFLEAQAEVRPEQRAFLEHALAYYQRYVSEDAAGPDERDQRGRAYRRIGHTLLRLGRLEEAVAPYQQAITVYDGLVDDHPASAEYRRSRARSLAALAAAYHAQTKPDDAETFHRLALRDHLHLRDQFPGVPGHERDLGATYEALGKIYMETSQRNRAEEAFNQALGAFEKLAEADPANADRQFDLAAIRRTMCVFYRNTGRPKEGLPLVGQAIAALEQLHRDRPAVAEYQQDLAETYLVQGATHAALRNLEPSEDAIRRGIALYEPLARLHPAAPNYQLALGRAYNELGLVLLDVPTKHDEAERQHRLGLAVLEKLGQVYPAVPRYQVELGRAHQGVGFIIRQRRPADPESEQHYLRAVAIQEKLARDHPTETRFGTDLATTYFKFGAMVSRKGTPAAALPWYEKSVATFEALLSREPRSLAARVQLRTVSIGKGRILMKLSRPQDALVDWDRAARLEENYLPAIHHERMLCLKALGRLDDALAEADRLSKEESIFAYAWVDLACVYGQAAGRGGTEAEKYASRAVEMLRTAVAKGYKNLADIEKDKDLDPLRGRADYQAAVAPLRMEKKP